MHRSLMAMVLVVGSCSFAPPGLPERTRTLLDLAPPGTAGRSSPRASPRLPRQEQAPRPQNHVDFMLGASHWDELGRLDPTGAAPLPGQFGEFDHWGFAFDIGYDRVVWSDGQSDWTLGLEFGWSTFDNDGTGLLSPYGDITASMFYLTPVMRWMVQVSPTVTVAPGIGGGYYGFSIDEFETYYHGWWWGHRSRTLNQDSSFGGFLSLGLDFHVNPAVAVRVDNKLHFVDFGGLQSLLPNETHVGGPIYTLEIGFALGF